MQRSCGVKRGVFFPFIADSSEQKHAVASAVQDEVSPLIFLSFSVQLVTKNYEFPSRDLLVPSSPVLRQPSILLCLLLHLLDQPPSLLPSSLLSQKVEKNSTAVVHASAHYRLVYK